MNFWKSSKKLDLTEQRLKNLEIKVFELECEHRIESREVISSPPDTWCAVFYEGFETCTYCGKIFQHFNSEKKLKKREVEVLKEQLKRKQKLLKRKKQNG